ncbi:CPBP family intramembrane glutamic endopeptidase [Frigoriglobus tundricola]|uniref:CAAX prenyl protease 2/Lysostaphin resistance protein A-like domain-containing protein n=1 Tax=Frigoriglobus tundricola TaxID=2774151 RepID=A0A6M5YUD0_9BACT|nr:CPBP family intramembrane glutamic endopeptidase [Frigoriglobus tundricola]QJW97509.1 hypothetical protein FTUN_5083 [Frigoriglobus tundricola]
MPPHDHDRAVDSDLPPALAAWEVVEPAPGPAARAVFCRRCGETSEPVANCCPWCGAWLVGDPPVVAPVYVPEDEPEDEWHTRAADAAAERYAPRRGAAPLVPPLVVVFVSYGLLLGSLILFLVFAVLFGLTNEEDQHAGLAVVEAIDAVLAVAGLGLVWNTAKQKLPGGTMWLTWLTAFPVLFVLLCLNLAYITFLRELLRPLGAPEPQKMKLTLVTVLLVCAQPAIVEELFFRQMTLGVFRKSMNLHLAVWATAGLFAFAHLANPIGMPYLFLAGGAFGYARAFGGLTLAMVLHFVHNFAVVAYDALK